MSAMAKPFSYVWGISIVFALGTHSLKVVGLAIGYGQRAIGDGKCDGKAISDVWSISRVFAPGTHYPQVVGSKYLSFFFDSKRTSDFVNLESDCT